MVELSAMTLTLNTRRSVILEVLTVARFAVYNITVGDVFGHPQPQPQLQPQPQPQPLPLPLILLALLSSFTTHWLALLLEMNVTDME